MKKQINIGFIFVIFLIIILVVGIVFIKKDSSKEISDEYELEIIDIGRKFYKESFYPTIENPSLDIQEFSETGLNFSLSTLNDYSMFSDHLKEYLNNKKCDYASSKVFVYPEVPFKANDFEIELYLDCNK